MTDDRWAGVPDLLSRLEDKELRLLSWGIVDGFLSQADVHDAIDAQLDQDAERPDAVLMTIEDYLDHLLDAGLLHRLPDATLRYRTRLGETLRLLRTLRQLWPPRDASVPGWWRNSSTLVADYRLRVEPRRYPRRSISLAEAVEDFAGIPGWTDLHADVLRRIVGHAKLAKFQAQATASILVALTKPQMSARIITAGTGSGKTLAFYLPALLDIAARARTRHNGPHTLALYPRNELLRDQARETLRIITDLGALEGSSSRPARIGLLYGSTPYERDLHGKRETRGWQPLGQGWASPYFPCLTENCVGSLVWTNADRAAGHERLVCTACTFTTTPGTLALTRESMVKDPPDILFSTTEMLSKHATSSGLARLLGWKGPNGTRLVLLDEVHSYSGVHGAQVGLMLRRWRHANRRWGTDSPVMVGLSATLRDAGDFFAALTGAERSNVEVIAPTTEDMVPISREYGIVLRGDPISGAQLLSTTIQSAMLLGRVLDNVPGIYGSVAFAFTDDLDVINRLYDNLRDAEGHSPRGRAAGTVLAVLRSPEAPQAGPRYADGQSWDLPFHLQRMERALRIARTSSQDTGVDAGADVITATSSLEVGFNDPRVGAVLQHKSPRDLASFLQRRGRAGRKLAMRPLTVVVLSDYGRDRIAYQTYEKLLDPEIDARSLPINNRFVVKIQAAHALIDWIGQRTGADARAVLSPPRNASLDPKTHQVSSLLRELLTEGERRQELAEHLRRSLTLSADEVIVALWEEPRSLLLSVVPTALRRLESSWTPLPNEVDPGAQERTPLPEFMTETLFASLNTPDVRFELPGNFGTEQPAMPIAQALREAVPGRVSRRFGYAHAALRTWLPVPAVGSELPLTDVIAKGHGLGAWTTSDGERYSVVRPLSIRLVSPPPDVADTSQTVPLWRSAFEHLDAALHYADVPTPSVWAELVDTCAFALHVGGGPLKVRRMAIGSDGELTLRTGARSPLHVRYVHDGLPAAIGFELDVDAMILTGELAEGGPFLGDFPASPEWRTLSFRRRVLEDPRLDDVANIFQRQWLCEVYLDAFVQIGLVGGDISRAADELAGGRWAADLDQFLAIAYRADQNGVVSPSRMLGILTDLASNSTVRTVIEEHGRLLVAEDLRDKTADLLDRVFVDALANAVLAAVEESSPDAQEGDLAVDVEFDTASRKYRIIVSETSMGGLGHIEALHRYYVLDPRRFWDAVGRVCEPTEAENVDESMRAILGEIIDPKTAIARSVAEFRRAVGIAEMDKALETLLATWTESDGPPGHLLVSTFAARMLRPGSKPAIDRIVSDLATTWTQLEARLRIEIDARTLTFHASRGDLGIDIKPLSADAAFSMLWLRGPQARGQQLEHWHPYRSDVVVERLILEGAIRDRVMTVNVTQSGWLVDYTNAVQQDGRVVLSAPYPSRASLAEALREVTVTPIERSGLRVYSRVTGIYRRHRQLWATLLLAEELQ